MNYELLLLVLHHHWFNSKSEEEKAKSGEAAPSDLIAVKVHFASELLFINHSVS